MAQRPRKGCNVLPEITVYLPDVPGQFSRVLTALDEIDVNIRGFSVDLGGATSQLRLLFADKGEAERAKKALFAVPYEPIEKELLLLSAKDEPGTLLKVAMIMAENDINVEYGYVVLGTVIEDEVLFALKVPRDKSDLAIEKLAAKGITDHDHIPDDTGAG